MELIVNPPELAQKPNPPDGQQRHNVETYRGPGLGPSPRSRSAGCRLEILVRIATIDFRAPNRGTQQSFQTPALVSPDSGPSREFVVEAGEHPGKHSDGTGLRGGYSTWPTIPDAGGLATFRSADHFGSQWKLVGCRAKVEDLLEELDPLERLRLDPQRARSDFLSRFARNRGGATIRFRRGSRIRPEFQELPGRNPGPGPYFKDRSAQGKVRSRSSMS